MQGCAPKEDPRVVGWLRPVAVAGDRGHWCAAVVTVLAVVVLHRLWATRFGNCCSSKPTRFPIRYSHSTNCRFAHGHALFGGHRYNGGLPRIQGRLPEGGLCRPYQCGGCDRSGGALRPILDRDRPDFELHFVIPTFTPAPTVPPLPTPTWFVWHAHRYRLPPSSLPNLARIWELLARPGQGRLVPGRCRV